jgi:hypothetical protein
MARSASGFGAVTYAVPIQVDDEYRFVRSCCPSRARLMDLNYQKRISLGSRCSRKAVGLSVSVGPALPETQLDCPAQSATSYFAWRECGFRRRSSLVLPRSSKEQGWQEKFRNFAKARKPRTCFPSNVSDWFSANFLDAGFLEVGSCALDDARSIAKFVGKPVAHNRPSRRDWCFVGGSRVRPIWVGWSFVSQRSPPTRLLPQSG